MADSRPQKPGGFRSYFPRRARMDESRVDADPEGFPGSTALGLEQLEIRPGVAKQLARARINELVENGGRVAADDERHGPGAGRPELRQDEIPVDRAAPKKTALF